MTTAAEWVAFLNARLDEDEARAKDDFVCEPIAVKERTLREVAFKRAILGLFVSAFGGINVTIIAGTRTINGDWLLRQMAAIYSDHPDYPQDGRR